MGGSWTTIEAETLEALFRKILVFLHDAEMRGCGFVPFIRIDWVFTSPPGDVSQGYFEACLTARS